MSHLSPMSIVRCVCMLVIAVALLKICKTWLSDHSSSLLSKAGSAIYEENDDDLSHLKDPGVKTQRCDACRIIAARFDTGFELAETHLLDDGDRSELDEGEVNAIVGRICRKQSFEQIRPFHWKGQHRLAGPGIETWRTFLRKQQEEEEGPPDILFRQRMRNHCRFYAEKLKGLEIYDMWLRTSAGRRGRKGVAEGFDSFLCYGGPGVFGDCLDWIGVDERWPAGDEEAENEEEDEDLVIGFLLDTALSGDKSATTNSVSWL